MKFFIRRFFKKAISLVLVLAMLAGFAGMTGYSPASLIANAADYNSRVTYKFDGGYSVTIAEVLYKTPAVTVGGTTYTPVYNNDKGTQDVAMTSGYYGIPRDLPGNDLSVTVSAPTDGKWRVHCSLTKDFKDKNTAGWGYPDNNIATATYTRQESDAENDEYGILFVRHLNDATSKGYLNVDKVYWRLEYYPDGKSGEAKFSDPIEVNLVDYTYQYKDSTKPVTWSGAATSSETSKPKDSQAGKNAMLEWKVPTTLYVDSNGNIVTSVSGNTFATGEAVSLDTNISFSLPAGTKGYRYSLGASDANDAIKWQQVHQSTTAQSDLNAPITYTGSGLYSSYTGTGSFSKWGVWYRIDYDMDVTLSDGTVKEVTYTQFAFTKTQSLPRYKVAYAIESNLDDSKSGNGCDPGNEGNDTYTTIYQQINLSGFLKSGLQIVPQNWGTVNTVTGNGGEATGVQRYISDGSDIPGQWNKTWGYYDTANSVVRFMRSMRQATLGEGQHYFGQWPGVGWNSNPSTAKDVDAAVGAKLYYIYDEDNRNEASASVAAPLLTQFLSNGKNGTTNEDRDTNRECYGSNNDYTQYSAGWSYLFLDSNTKLSDNTANNYYNTSNDTLSWSNATSYGGHTLNERNISIDNGIGVTASSWVPGVVSSSSKSSRDNNSKWFVYTGGKLTFNSSVYSGTAQQNKLLLFKMQSNEDGDGSELIHTNYVAYNFTFVPRVRTNAYDFIEKALSCNYVEAEMDPTWWNSYMSKVCEAYLKLGVLTGTDSEKDFSDSNNMLDNPEYVFADYTDLNNQILSVAPWDRGGKDSNEDGTADAGYHTWGSLYAEWNANTYSSNGKVAGALAVYDLKFNDETNEFYVSTDPRTGEYYYTADSWSKYVAARNNAVAVYNYATSGTFSYDTAYPAKTPSNGDRTVGLACYYKSKVDAAATELSAAREALKKKDVSNGYNINYYYGVLLDAVNTLTYDGESLMSIGNEGKVPKHGLDIADNQGRVYYDSAKLSFRATHPDDVFSCVYTEEEANEYNLTHTDQVGNGWVYVNAEGKPLGAKDGSVTAEEIGDIGIEYFPPTGRPVGQGNTFSQLMFDNSEDSGFAVDNARLALQNRLRWYKGGGSDNTAYKYLKMQQGAYTESSDADQGTNPDFTLTEAHLISNPESYMWSGVEHQDDILRAAYAMYRVAQTLRLATNYKGVYDALNATNGIVPEYDAMGSTYTTKQLHNVTLFHGYVPEAAWDQADEKFTVDNITYNTTGKTWYTQETWKGTDTEPGFIAARNKLARLLFNGNDQIGQDFDYKSSLTKVKDDKYYTYDVVLTSGTVITNTYYTNSAYYSNKTNPAIDEEIDNRAAYGQAYVNRLVDEYKAWFDGNPDNNELVPKNLDEYNWMFDEENNYATVGELENGEYTEDSIKWKVNAMLVELKREQVIYDFETLREDPEDSTKITGAELISEKEKTRKISYYNTTDEPYKTAYTEAVAAADAILAITAGVPNFDGDDNLGDKVGDLHAKLNTLKTNYETVVGNGQYTDDSAWDGIINHLNELAGVLDTDNEITRGQLAAKFKEFYNDRTFDADGDESTAQVSVAAEITAAVADFDKVNNAADKQKAVNDAVERLYNALNNTATAYDIAQVVGIEKDPTTGEAVTPANGTVLSYPNEYTFKVYNYSTTNRSGSCLVRSKFTDGSIAILEAQARAYRDHEYPMLSTYTSEIDEHELAASNLKKLESEGGVLVEMGAVTEYLSTAIDYAEGELYDIVDGEKVVKTFVATSPEDTTVNVPIFTEQSIAELQAIIEEARAAIENGHAYTDQLVIDKLTWAVYEETTDNTQYLVAANATFLEGMYGAPYKWETVDGELKRTNVDKWGAETYESLLYGNRNDETWVGLDKYGLQDAPPYLDFLEIELSTPHELDVEGKHWYLSGDKKGWAILTDGKVSTDTVVFDGGSWGDYANAYNRAYGAYTTGTYNNVTLTYKDQVNIIDALAKEIYDTRNALKSGVRYFPNNSTDFAIARNYYNTLEAYLATTPITRYEVVKDADGNITGVSNAKADNVPLYTFPTLGEAQEYPVYEKVTLEDGSDVLDGDQKPVYVPVTEQNDEGEEVQKYASTDDTRAILEAYITMYRAKYASSSSTEPLDSLKAATKLYNEINGYTNDAGEFVPGLVQTLGITLKKTNDASFMVGFNDLVDNFIAGDWNTSTSEYTSDLLNDTQIRELDTELDQAWALFNADTDAYADFGNVTLKSQTDDVFNYTKNAATDLQFATYMRYNELYEFMGLTVRSKVDYYYGNGVTYEIPMFKEENVEQIKSNVDRFFKELEWPYIYEVNGVKWSKGDGKDVAAFVTGYEYTNGTYTGSVESVVDILNMVGSRSGIYAQVANELTGVNVHNAQPYNWLCENAFKIVPTNYSDVSKRGDETVLSKYTLAEGETYPKAYNAGETWYTEGYAYYTDGAKGYYLYDSAKNGTWFMDITGVESNRENTMVDGWPIKDLVAETDITGAYAWQLGEQYWSYVHYLNDPGKDGWHPEHNTGLVSAAEEMQTSYYDYYANALYEELCALQLRPATEAYREVYNTYLSVRGEEIKPENWQTNTIFNGVVTTLDYYKFYNLDEKVVLKALGKEDANNPNYSETNPDYNAVPPSAVAPYSSNLWGQYKSAGEYSTGTDYMAGLQTFMEDLLQSGKEGHDPLITIDQADKVNVYGTIDGEPTIMKVLIDEYLSKLQVKDLVYNNLNAVVSAFLSNNLSAGLAANKATIESLTAGFVVGGNYEGKFYDLSYYTDESLLTVTGVLRDLDILADEQIIDRVVNPKEGEHEFKWLGTFPSVPIELDAYKGEFYNKTTEQSAIDGSVDNSALGKFLNALNYQLVLKPADTSALSATIKEFSSTINDAKYEQNNDWKNYSDYLAYAEGFVDKVKTEGWTILRQAEVTAVLDELVRRRGEIDLLADNYAPQMKISTSADAVKAFYNDEAHDKLKGYDTFSYNTEGKADPAVGTFFVPNGNSYSLFVYTNELHPRIVINLKDMDQVLVEGSNGSADVVQDAAKQEHISITSKRTSDVKANVIAGTLAPDADNKDKFVMNIDETSGTTTGTKAVTVTNGADAAKNSSVFAILAPDFVDGTSKQAVVYTIAARDGSARNVDGSYVFGNYANQFEFGEAGQNPVNINVFDGDNITVYVHYYSLKDNDGRNEGISTDGTELATPAIGGTHVPSVLLSGEPNFQGKDWRSGILLQRHFSDIHSVWEYVSEIEKNEDGQYNVNGNQVPVYKDPTFNYLNTGSFYYVLDRDATADTVDGKVIAKYNNGKNSEAGRMDYDSATAAKDLMISEIKANGTTLFETMKKSGRFYDYGDYNTDGNGNVLYYDDVNKDGVADDDGKKPDDPQWINWAQAIGGKVENGDLVFVHVVDRWGNVVNRIIEITNLDKIKPTFAQTGSDEPVDKIKANVTITENGYSGIADIQIHNGDFSLGNVNYKIEDSQQQKVEYKQGPVGNMQVECASESLTLTGLVPGKTYYVGATDKAGNSNNTPVEADATGSIVITLEIEVPDVEPGEEGSVVNNSTTFTLNGTDTIILNSGEASSVINADIDGNVFANRIIRHYVTTKDNVMALKTVYQDGTEKEWTSSNSLIKDNGDGTSTWTISHKLAEGDHSIKVYAKVNSVYEAFYAPVNVTATTKTVTLTYTVIGMGSIVLNYSGARETKDSSYNSVTIPYGAKVTIAAENNTDGCEFYYWVNNTTNRIISTATEYSFKAVTNVNCNAQFTSCSTYYEGQKLVVYVNNAKNVVKAFELADGESYTVPTGPVLPDYTFKGWSMTKDEVLESDKDTIIVEPIYELNASNTVTITEGNYTATGAGTYTAVDNQRAVATISTSAKDGDGKEFLYWIDADTDEIVSYDRTYSFFCVKDTVLTPVYGDASTVQAEPIVRITEVKYNALSGKVSFFAERSVPEEFVILQTGIVVTKTESIGTNEEVFVVGGTSTAAGTSTSTANNGYYSANATVATGQTVWARAYVIYETADGEIFEAYGPVVSYTVD